MKTGIELIAEERKEQVEKHGRTVELDVLQNSGYQLSNAAQRLLIGSDVTPSGWDKQIWYNMCRKSRREKLIIAGALIAAEIDRLQAIESNGYEGE